MDKFPGFFIVRATQLKTRLRIPEPVPRVLLSVMSHSSPFSFAGLLNGRLLLSCLSLPASPRLVWTHVSTLEPVTPKLTPNESLPWVPHLDYRAPRTYSEPSPPEAFCLLFVQGEVTYHLSHMLASWDLAWTISPEVCTPSSAPPPNVRD